MSWPVPLMYGALAIVRPETERCRRSFLANSDKIFRFQLELTPCIAMPDVIPPETLSISSRKLPPAYWRYRPHC
jgi:hypothetical protein